MRKINKKKISILLIVIFIILAIVVTFLFRGRLQQVVCVSDVANINEAYNVKVCFNKFYLYYKENKKNDNAYMDMLYELIDSDYLKYYNISKEELKDNLKEITSDEVQIDKIYKIQQKNNLSLYMVEATELYKNSEVSNKFNALIKLDNKNNKFSVFLENYIIDNSYNELKIGDKLKIKLNDIELNDNNSFNSNYDTDNNINNIFDEYIRNCTFYERRAYDLLSDECKEIKYTDYETFDSYITSNFKDIVTMKLIAYECIPKDGYIEYRCTSNKGKSFVFKVTSYITYTVTIE